MDERLIANATIIDLLRDAIALQEAKFDSIETQVKNLQPAHDFMEQLIKAIKQDWVVYYAWCSFLQAAAIDEPEWKDDYLPVEEEWDISKTDNSL